MTSRIYYTDQACCEFDATVLELRGGGMSPTRQVNAEPQSARRRAERASSATQAVPDQQDEHQQAGDVWREGRVRQ